MPRRYNYECGECGEKFESYYRTWQGKPTRGRSLLQHRSDTGHDIRTAEIRERDRIEDEEMRDAMWDGYIGDGDWAF